MSRVSGIQIDFYVKVLIWLVGKVLLICSLPYMKLLHALSVNSLQRAELF